MLDERLKHYAELVTNVIYKYSLNAQAQIDTKYKEQLAQNVFILTHIYDVLDKIVNHPKQDEISNELFESQAIIWQASNTMISSIQLIRQGYVLEPQYLMRVAFESLCLALSFHVDPQAFSKYENYKLSGKDCVNHLKLLIKNAGMMYGTLSKVTHPSKRTTGVHYNIHSNTIIVGGGYTEKLAHRTLFNLSLSSFILLTIWETVEFIFYDFNTTQHFWSKSDDTYKSAVAVDLKQMLKKIETDFSTALAAIDANKDDL